jgi:uncharacterized membrane protein
MANNFFESGSFLIYTVKLTRMNEDVLIALVLLLITAAVWYTSHRTSGFWKKLYSVVPPMILLFLIPSILGSFGFIQGGDSASARFALSTLLPITLLLMTMTINFHDILALSRKSVVIFLAGTVGIVAGGPLALWIVGQFSPDLLADKGSDSVWRGLVCITGAWINGTPGQTSMKEIFGASHELYFVMIAVDAVMQNLWLALLLFGVRSSGWIDRVLKADPEDLATIQQAGMEKSEQKKQQPSGNRKRQVMELIAVALVGFGVVYYFTSLMTNYFVAQQIPDVSVWSFLAKPSFWLVFFSTTLGIGLSFTRARELEAVGATEIGNFFFYFLFSAIGLKMNLFRLGGQWEFILICAIWLLIHLAVLLVAARLVRGSYFFVAVGSQANIGGPATASMLASAFNPHLASVGVLLGVLSNVIGNYCGLIAGILYRWLAG